MNQTEIDQSHPSHTLTLISRVFNFYPFSLWVKTIIIFLQNKISLLIVLIKKNKSFTHLEKKYYLFFQMEKCVFLM